MTDTTVTLNGRITHLSGSLLEGWVHAPHAPKQQWAIAIYAHGQLLALSYAEHYHPDAPGTGMHGFKVMLSDAQLNSSRELTLTLANHTQVLDTLRLPAPPSAEHTPATSRVQHLPGLLLRGWLLVPETNASSLSVTAYKGEHPIATALPQRAHGGKHAEASFSLGLPFSLADGQPHTITVKDSQGRELNGSPLTVQEWPQGLMPWLKQLAPKLPNDTQALLRSQLERYETWLARAARLRDYPAWQQAFSASSQPIRQPGTLGLIWLGEPTPQALNGKEAALKGLKIRHYVYHEPATGDASSAYQALLEEAIHACDAIAPLESGDTLAPHALAHAWNALHSEGTQLAYSDFDMPSGEHATRQPACLPAWDPERHWCQDYLTGGLCLVRSHLLQHNAHPASSADELSYAAIEALNAAGYPESAVVHVPHIARHRANPWLTATSDAQLARLQARLTRQDPQATLSRHATQPGLYRLHRTLEQWPSITLVIPTRDALTLLRRCIETIEAHTDYPGRVHLLVVDNNSQQPDTHAYFNQLRQRPAQPLGRGQLTFDVLEHPYPFNYAAINNAAVAHSDSELIALVNNDIEALHPEWLSHMAALLMRPNTGAVGAKLLWPNGMVQHGGVVGGQFGGLAGHVGNTWNEEDAGYLGMNHLTQRFSAVTAACLLLRKSDYQRVGGLDERAFPVGFNDVDLCLKLRQLGLSVLWTPEARLIHAESATRGKDEAPEKAARAQREMDNLRHRWSNALMNDPAYHPSLGLDVASAPYTSLAMPPRTRSARTNALPR